MIDIDDNRLSSNMEYDETDFDSDSEIDDYNYNSNTNNWSTLTGRSEERRVGKEC